MKNLITITNSTIGKEEINAVDARELWVFLESKQQFGNWIKDRINKYDFAQGVDFISFNKFIKAENTYINTKEYTVSIDMAKELSMVENNSKGKEARKYFIRCEKKLKSLTRKLPESKLEWMELCVDTEKKRLLLETTNKAQIEKIKKDRPKVEFADKILSSKGSMDIGTFSKLISKDGFAIGRNRLFKLLRDKGVLQKNNIPYQKFMNKGWLIVVENTFIKNDVASICIKTEITPKGQIIVGNGVARYFKEDKVKGEK